MIQDLLTILERAVAAYEKEVAWKTAISEKGFPFADCPGDNPGDNPADNSAEIPPATLEIPAETPQVVETVAEPVQGKPAEKSAEPTEIPPVSLEQIREAIIALVHAKGREPVEAIVKSFGVGSVSDLPADRYPEILARVQEVANAA